MNGLKFNFCCWNVRGLGQSQKCSDVLSELIAINPHACFLQETKLSSITNSLQNKFSQNTSISPTPCRLRARPEAFSRPSHPLSLLSSLRTLATSPKLLRSPALPPPKSSPSQTSTLPLTMPSSRIFCLSWPPSSHPHTPLAYLGRLQSPTAPLGQKHE